MVRSPVLVAGVIIWITRGLHWLDPVTALSLAAVIDYARTRLAVMRWPRSAEPMTTFDND